MAYITFQPKDYFNTLLYTATGVQSLTGLGFQPDMSWVKSRSTTSSHNIEDAVRGSTKTIKSDSTAAEVTQDLITSFDSDGVTLGTANWSDSRTAVIWNWKANGSGSSNTDGSITSTVSANTTSGFSIVTWNGQTGTVGHGLGAKPAFIVVKCLAISNNWVATHKGLGNLSDNYIILNSTGASGSTNWGGEPTSSVFSINANVAEPNNNIAYCFSEVKGFSKFGSYVGNGSADGAFVYTGFKPAFLIIKPSSAIENWQMFDSKRPGYNACDNLSPNNTNAEETTSNKFVDLVSNGFKLRSATYAANGISYIYMAFAESPLVTSNGLPATAR